VVDAAGRVTARLASGVEGTLEARAEGRRGATPYARWLSASGLWPLWGAMGLAFFMAWRAARGVRRRT
jgi:apolipoprotein N-acyltransferase